MQQLIKKTIIRLASKIQQKQDVIEGHKQNQKTQNQASQLQQKSLQSNEKAISKQQITLLFSYISTNQYFLQIKKTNRYIHWISTQQKRKVMNLSYLELVKQNIANKIKQLLVNIKENKNIIDERKIVVLVILGKVIYKNKTYSTGDWLEVGQEQDKLQVQQKSICIIFQKASFQQQIFHLNQFHYKKQQFKKLFLQKINFSITQKKIDEIVDRLSINTINQKNMKINIEEKQQQQNKGILLLTKGSYIISDWKSKLKISQISQTYFWEECLWRNQYEYQIKTNSNANQFIFVSRDVLIVVLSEQQLIEIKQKLKKLFQFKKKARNQTFKSIEKVKGQIIRQKIKIKQPKRSKTQIQQIQKQLKSMKKQKPLWKKEDQKEKNNISNKRRNIFTSQAQGNSNRSKRKYFSLRFEQKSQQQQKQFLKKHFSQHKFSINKSHTKPKLSIHNNSLFSTFKSTNFSKVSKTQYLKTNQNQFNKTFEINKSKSETKLKSQSEQVIKTQKINFNKWDIEYSKIYDRQIADCYRKQKHLKLIKNLKDKLFPKEKLQLFTLDDAFQSRTLSFYQLEKKRREILEERNKRAFQKVFKVKMLTTHQSSRAPQTFR